MWKKAIPKKYTRPINFPPPDYSLVRTKDYASLTIQYSRGCPFNCEFCDVTSLFGHKVRTKTTPQFIRELDHLRAVGGKGSLFIVDDNFIGNKALLKRDLLPAMALWMQENKQPFSFVTEATINLADDQELIDMMVAAGFSKVFIGIETPDTNCLDECNKTQNNNRDMIDSVNRIQKSGIEVSAGFIVGFDGDTTEIFQKQIDFIQSSGIISAMVGLLNAPRKTKLYDRLQKEGRILEDISGDNTDFSLNFIPKMNRDTLLEGYRKVINGIYSSKAYYQRVKLFMASFDPPAERSRFISFGEIKAIFKSFLIMGVLKKNRRYFWKLFFWSLFFKPLSMHLAFTYSIYGYHFRKIFNQR